MDDKQEIKRQIDMFVIERDRRIEVIESDFQELLDPLYDRLNEIEADETFAKFGFRDGDELRATPAFLELIQDKRNRNCGRFKEWTQDAVYHISHPYHESKTASINCIGGGGTGLIPFDIIRGMREAYLAHTDAAQLQT